MGDHKSISTTSSSTASGKLTPLMDILESNDSLKLKVDDSQKMLTSSLKPTPSLLDTKTSSKTKDRMLKKSWSAAVQKNDEFKRIFKDVPANESLVTTFSCALQKEILLQGKMFITMRHVCFYSNILGWETQLLIKFKDIKGVQKMKTAMLIPNAVRIQLENEKLFFTSLTSRDKTYEILYKIWQKEINNDPLNNQDIRTILRNSLIEDVEFHLDSRDDNLASSIKSESNNATSNNYYSSHSSENNNHQNLASNDNPGAAAVPPDVDADSSSNSSYIYLKTDSLLKSDKFSAKSKSAEKLGDTKSTGMSTGTEFNSVSQLDAKSFHSVDTTNSEHLDINNNTIRKNSVLNSDYEIILQKEARMNFGMESGASTESLDPSLKIECECTVHEGKELLSGTYNISSHYLFECIFGDTEFCAKYWETRKFGDIKVSKWEDNAEGYQCRTLEYSVGFGKAMGFKQLKNTENQKILKYIPNKVIVVESHSVTHGIRYAEYFMVVCRFCITKADNNTTSLKIHGRIIYLQKPFGFIQTIIEKSSMGAIGDSMAYLDKKLGEEVENQGLQGFASDISAVRHLQKPEVIITPEEVVGIEKQSPKLTVKKVTRIRRRLANSHSEDYSSTSKNKKNNKKRTQTVATQSDNTAQLTTNAPQLVPIQTFAFARMQINVDTLVRLFIIAMMFLMIINGILYLKLLEIENFARLLQSHPKLASLNSSSERRNYPLNSKFNEKEAFNIKEVFSNTAKAINKMSETLNEWNDSFERYTNSNASEND